MNFEWADAGNMTIWNDANLQEVSEATVTPGEIGASLDTGSNGVMIWGTREQLISMAVNLIERLQAGEGASAYGEVRGFAVPDSRYLVQDATGDVYEAKQLYEGYRFRDNFAAEIGEEDPPAPEGALWEVVESGAYKMTPEGPRFVISARMVIES